MASGRGRRALHRGAAAGGRGERLMSNHPAIASLRSTVDRGAGRIAVRDNGTTLTAGELGQRVHASASAWIDLGAVPGDAVLLIGSRTVELPVALLGAWDAGLVPVLV